MRTRTIHPVVFLLALASNVCCLTLNAWGGANARFDILTVDDTVITRGPLVDVRAFMDGQSGRPTLARWQSDQANTDVTAAIQAAVDSLPSHTSDKGVISPKGYANGGTVLIPRGRYKVTSSINLKRGIRIVGVGREASQIVSYTTGSVLRYLDAGRYIPDEIVVENLSIWQDASVTATSGAGIEVNTGTSSVPAVYFKGANLLIEGTYHGLLLQAGMGCSLRDSFVSKTRNHGIYIYKGGTVVSGTTSTVFESVYSNQSVGGDGFRFEGSAYINCVSCASDSNFRHGYSVKGGYTINFSGCGAESNGHSGLYLEDTNGVSATVSINSSAGLRHGITLHNAANTVVSGSTFAGNASTTGYALHVEASPKPLVVISPVFAGVYNKNKIDNTTYALFLNNAYGGFFGGFTNSWILGSATSPDKTTQLRITGNADSSVTTGLAVNPTFAVADAVRNTVSYVQPITANHEAIYPLLVGQYVANAYKGAASTITRSAGIYADDQTRGSTANAAIMIGGTERTVPSGNWSIYSSSAHDSVFVGKVRLGSSTGPTVSSGAGSPNNVVTAPVGSLFLRTDGTVGSTLYVKESGTGKSGWVAK